MGRALKVWSQACLRRYGATGKLRLLRSEVSVQDSRSLALQGSIVNVAHPIQHLRATSPFPGSNTIWSPDKVQFPEKGCCRWVRELELQLGQRPIRLTADDLLQLSVIENTPKDASGSH